MLLAQQFVSKVVAESDCRCSFARSLHNRAVGPGGGKQDRSVARDQQETARRRSVVATRCTANLYVEEAAGVTNFICGRGLNGPRAGGGGGGGCGGSSSAPNSPRATPLLNSRARLSRNAARRQIARVARASPWPALVRARFRRLSNWLPGAFPLTSTFIAHRVA